MCALTKQLISKLSYNTLYLSVLSAFGLALSLYALHVETQHSRDPHYRAFCDINRSMSCSAVFSSKYGKGFGLLPPPFDVPNAIYGLIFYMLQLLIGNIVHQSIFLCRIYVINAVLSNIGSIYLGYVLYFILHDFCLVCITTYVVNFLMLLLGLSRLSTLKSVKQLKKD